MNTEQISAQILAPSNEVVASIINNLRDSAITGAHNSKKEEVTDYILTGVKLEKLGMFMPYFGDRTEEFVYKCTGRGENSWKKIAKRIHDLDIANEQDTAYAVRLYEEFELDTAYDIGAIITTVGTVRRELHLPIGEQNTKWYTEQVCNLFLSEKIMDENVAYAKVQGYKFLFKLKP